MPFIPHTDQDVASMLESLGIENVEQLFDEIPDTLRLSAPLSLLPTLNESAMMRLMSERADQDKVALSFLGAGAYDHHIPAAVWDIVGRGEFMTAYTPYQAEASQGSLQVIYEFQSMMCRLTGLPVSNASLYDGATALAEAVLMSVRSNKKNKSSVILVPENLNPAYVAVCSTLTSAQGIVLKSVPVCSSTGCLSLEILDKFSDLSPCALIIGQPNFFGGVELPDALTDWAHQKGAHVIGVVNPMSLAILKPPGQWGSKGADIVVGEGQPLGVPLSSGGPYFGFMCCSKSLVRQMPGRIVGRTQDAKGNTGFTLTLQPREQHIRRAKATSNICTNQGLLVTAATIYMSLLGDSGLQKVALQCHNRVRLLWQVMQEQMPSMSLYFPKQSPFHELVVRLPVSAKVVAERMAEERILAGLPLLGLFPSLADADNALLVCATEQHTPEDIQRFVSRLKQVIEEVEQAGNSQGKQNAINTVEEAH